MDGVRPLILARLDINREEVLLIMPEGSNIPDDAYLVPDEEIAKVVVNLGVGEISVREVKKNAIDALERAINKDNLVVVSAGDAVLMSKMGYDVYYVAARTAYKN